MKKSLEIPRATTSSDVSSAIHMLDGSDRKWGRQRGRRRRTRRGFVRRLDGTERMKGKAKGKAKERDNLMNTVTSVDSGDTAEKCE